MGNCPLCNLDPTPTPSEPTPPRANRPTRLLDRAWKTVQWLAPTTLLILMPKCPMCVAAYIALFTGISISIPTARWLQILMFAFCLTSLAYLAFRLWRTRFKPRQVPVSSTP